ncbi:MAG: hypothetical protein K6C40_08680 [Thermoguttaceae bacterium]|nr:hypothetical protein [Thermoguttaceae bacterium]
MANLPDYVASAKPNPLENRAPWWKNTAQTYAGIMLWFVFWTKIPGTGVSQTNPAGLLTCGLGTALAALVLAAFLCHFLFYLVPGKLGMKTGLPLYIVGTSTYGVRGGFLMPGFLMGLLQYGWLAVNAWGSGTLFTCMIYGVGAGDARNYLVFYVIAIVWACAAAFVGLKGIKYVAGVATWFPIIPIVVLIALFVKTMDGIKDFDPAKVTASAPAVAEEVVPAAEEATPADDAPVASEATADEVAEDAAPVQEASPIAKVVEKAETVATEVAEKAETVATEAAEKTEAAAAEVAEKTDFAAEKVAEKTEEVVTEVTEKAEEFAAGAVETVKAATEEVKETTEEVVAAAPETVAKVTAVSANKPLSKFAVFNLMLAYILGFFATAGAAGCDMGAANRDSKDIHLGGLVGIVGSTVFAGGLSLAICAGAYGNGCDLPLNETTDLMNWIMGDTLGKVFLFALAIAAFPSACFCSMVAANSFKTTLPKVNPFITCGLGVLGAIILIVTRYAGDAGAVFGTIGASFGPICGAMAADYILSGFKWNGPRAGFNPAGWISWFFGFVVGAYGFFTSICPCLPQFEMPCPPLLACIVGFVLYFILAGIGCKTRTLPMDETNA